MAEWERVRLGDVLSQRKEFITIDDLSTYKRCRVQVRAQGVVLRDTVSGSDIKTKRQQVCRAGEFLVAEIDAKVGGFGLVPVGLDGAVVSSHYFLFQADASKLDKAFLDLYSKTLEFMEQVGAQGSTNYAAIRPSHVMDYTMPLPPLSEQQRIVARVKSLLEKVEEARRLKNEVVQLSAIILNKLMEQHLPPADGFLGDILVAKPKNGWSAVCDNIDGGIPVLTLKSITGFKYLPYYKTTSMAVDYSAKYWLEDGDLLITRSNTLELVGHAAIYSGFPFPCIYPDLIMKIEVDKAVTSNKFVHAWLMTEFVRSYIRENAKGTSPTMKKISQGVVSQIPFPTCLSLFQQGEYLKNFQNYRHKTEALKIVSNQSMTELDALPASILARAFAGAL